MLSKEYLLKNAQNDVVIHRCPNWFVQHRNRVGLDSFHLNIIY